MTTKTIQVGKDLLVKTSGIYLSIINATAQFAIEIDSHNTVAGKVGRQYDLSNITEVLFVNTGATAVDIEYEIANIKIFGAGNGTVTVENELVITRIVEGIEVSATVSSIEDGKMRNIRSNVLNPLADITIPANSNKLIIAANDVTNRRVTMQVISAALTTLRIGKDNTISAVKGAIIRGSIDDIATAVIENSSAIWVYNDSATVATVTLQEEYRP